METVTRLFALFSPPFAVLSAPCPHPGGREALFSFFKFGFFLPPGYGWMATTVSLDVSFLQGSFLMVFTPVVFSFFGHFPLPNFPAFSFYLPETPWEMFLVLRN